MIHAAGAQGARIEIPDELTLREAANQANASHLHLVTNGFRIYLTPQIQPGEFKVGVSTRPERKGGK